MRPFPWHAPMRLVVRPRHGCLSTVQCHFPCGMVYFLRPARCLACVSGRAGRAVSQERRSSRVLSTPWLRGTARWCDRHAVRRYRMPRRCSICTHADRRALETALGRGPSLRTIARRWSVSKTALLRHRDRHGVPQAQAAQAIPPVAMPAAVPHTLTACAEGLLAGCLPEVRQRYADLTVRLDWPLEDLMASGLNDYIRHLDQCPHYLSGPEV